MLRADESRDGPWTADPLHCDGPRSLPDDSTLQHGCVDATPRSVDDAIAEMGATGHHFCLFVEAGRGVDSMVRRVGGGMELLQIDGTTGLVVPGSAPVITCTHMPPLLDLIEAEALMRVTGCAFLFYVDRAHGRGTVLYRRTAGRGGPRIGLLDLGDVEEDRSRHLPADLL